MKRTPFFIANWKMNHGLAELSAFVEGFQKTLSETTGADIGISPQSPLLLELAKRIHGKAHTVAQNSGTKESGAFTGEISPALLRQLGVEWALLGHSERRHVFGESTALITDRVKAAIHAKIGFVLCVGEKLDERKSGNTWKVIEEQVHSLTSLRSELSNVPWALAYEPVWAIGTGETATPEQAQEVHGQLRGWVRDHLGSETGAKVRILYGGSVKPDNSAAIMAKPDVDGLLVGGASLSAAGFAEILKNGLESSNRRNKAS